MVESSLPDKAVNLYMKAAWVHEVSRSERLGQIQPD